MSITNRHLASAMSKAHPIASQSCDMPRAGSERRAAIIALTLYLGLLILFFYRPLLRMEAVSAADLIYSFDNYAYLNPANNPPSNPLLEDQVTQFEVWRTYAREQLWQGHFPWTNPYQGGGVPLVGNLQSAFFYPTQWLWFLLPANIAITLGAILKLLAAAMGTYVFLRALRISAGPAWIGGLMFAFGGFNIVWLGHPHTNVSVLLPWLLLCVYRSFDRGPSRGILAASVGVITLIIFGGHPATILHVLFAGFALALFLMVRRDKSGIEAERRRYSPVRLVGFWLLTGVLAAAFTAVQWVPFLRYLGQSDALQNRSAALASSGMPLRGLVAWVAPNIFGNPRDSNSIVSIVSIPLPKPLAFASGMLTDPLNFCEMMGGYVGSITLILALLSVFWCRNLRLWLWATVLGTFCLLVALGTWPLAAIIRHLPGFGVANNARFILLSGFCAIVLGSYMLDHLFCRAAITPKSSNRRAWVWWLVVGLAVMAIALAFPVASGHGSKPVRQATCALAILSGIGAATAGLIIALLRQRLAPRYVLAGLTMCLLTEIALYGLNYNPSFDFRERFPVTPGIAYLQQNAGDANILFLGGTLPPDLPTVYHLHDLRVYDAMEMRSHHALMVQLFAIGGQRQSIKSVPAPEFVSRCNQQYALNIRFVAVGAACDLAAEFRRAYASAIVYDRLDSPDLIIARVPADSASQPSTNVIGSMAR